MNLAPAIPLNLALLAAILLAGCATRPAELRIGTGDLAGGMRAADSAPASPVPGTDGLGLFSSWEAPLLREVAPDIGASAGEGPVASVAGSREATLVNTEGREPGLLYATPHPQQPPRGRPQNRFTLKGGYYAADDSALDDDGLIVNLAWMQSVHQPVAMEFELGYFDAEGRDGQVDAKVWAIPLMVNGRVYVPIGPVEIYGGIGIGTIYYDAKATGRFINVETEGFMAAANGFFGATINVGDDLVVGLEGKYYLTEEMHDLDTDLSAFAVMVTVGFRL